MIIKTQADFDFLIERIKNLVLQYENNPKHSNKYQMYLANGEKLSFEILEQSIPHLLGISLDYLRATNLFKNKDAYSLLKEFLENSYSVYRAVQNGHLTYSSLFSEHILEKLDSFEQIVYYFSPDDTEFVCKYAKSKTYQLGLDTNYPCDYFIAKKDKKEDIYLLGLVRQGNIFRPMSSMKFANDEYQSSSLKKLLTNQTLTFINNINVNNPITGFGNNSFLSISLKAKKMRTLKKYATAFPGVSIDASSDYQFIINGYSMKEEKINFYKKVCQQFAVKIKEHELFLLEQMDEDVLSQMDSEMIDMIEAYNNEACNSENEKAQITYSDLLKEYKTLCEQVKTLEQQLECIKEQSNIDKEKIQILQGENTELKEFQNDIFEVVKLRREKQTYKEALDNLVGRKK